MVYARMSVDSDNADIDRFEAICEVHEMQRLAHKTERQLINDQEDEADLTLEELRDKINDHIGAS